MGPKQAVTMIREKWIDCFSMLDNRYDSREKIALSQRKDGGNNGSYVSWWEWDGS